MLGWAVATDQVPDAAAISPMLNPHPGSDQAPINAIRISARLDMGMPLARVEAAYHQIALVRSKAVYDISLVGGSSEMDRDFVLNWQPVTGQEPQAAVFTEQVDGQHYALLMVVPPHSAVASAKSTTRRELILVVDTSGSMGGVSMEQARDSMDIALRQLQPGDYFNVIEFNSDYRALYRQPVAASGHNVARAREFVRHLQAGGGTEMLPALRSALQMPADGERLRQIIFITDGAVGNEDQLFQEIEQHLGRARLFTVGIGSAPNSWFMRKAADFGRGTHTHIGDVAEVAQRMDALFQQIAAPLAMNINVQWPGTDPVQSWPRRVPDLYRGEPILVAARLPRDSRQGVVTISGNTAQQGWSRQLQLADPGAAEDGGHSGVASVWARRKIASLLAEANRGQQAGELRDAVLSVALPHQLLSPYTSFVAVEERISRPAGEGLAKGAVANTRPRGQSPQSFAYPRTATTGPAKAWLGTLLLFLALLVHVLRRPDEGCERRDRG